MARPIVLSNGELHVGLNNYGLVHDFYFPYVGLENHAAARSLRHRIGVWIDGRVSWLDDDSENWQFNFSYPHTALIGHTVARNEKIGIILEFDDFVDSSITAFIRNIHIINMRGEAREVRLFMHQAFVIGDGRSNTDTAQYLPDSNAILHYRGHRAFVVAGEHNGEPFDQHSIGLFGIEGREGTYRDADDGELGNGAVEHGRVDSVLRFRFQLNGHSSERVNYWVAAGTSLRKALHMHKIVSEKSASTLMHRTAKWWHTWLAPALKHAETVPERYRDEFIRSVMIIKSQIDNRGAIMASTDTAMLNYSRDAYAYSWPRDGANIVWTLLRVGYTDEAYRFFEFCRNGLHPAGYLMHKYRADGALGSSWHPYVHGDIVGPPIQEDETALVLFVFAQYIHIKKDPSILESFYESMVVPMADFMMNYVDETTGLPKPSYDLWEEVYITTTYTTAVTYAGLHAAAEMAELRKDSERAVAWRSAAEDILTAAHRYLYNKDRKVFYKGVLVHDGQVTVNDVIDLSGIYGSFMFGLFPADSDEFRQSIRTVLSEFGYETGTLGFPRYEHDSYQKADPESLGNYWLITTLWIAQYFVEIDQMNDAKILLDWVTDRALPSGIMSEQIRPSTNEPLSVAPLTWSHAEYVATLLDYSAEQ